MALASCQASHGDKSTSSETASATMHKHSPAHPRIHRIALLFSANKVYDREIIVGIGDYLRSTRVTWDLFLEDDYHCRLAGIEHFDGDGIIADFDDPTVAEALQHCRLPIVAVGASYEDPAAYPSQLPYVAIDNGQLISLAYNHLIDAGLENFALYSLPESAGYHWAQERERIYLRLRQADQPGAHARDEVYRGLLTSAMAWNQASAQLIDWLRALPKPVGIIAVNDARARHLLQACLLADLAVPEQVAIIGIDNDPLARTLGRIPLSSVIQSTEEMGRTAAHLLHQMLGGVRLPGRRVLIPPVGINALASSRHQPLSNPYVMRANHFIRQYACQGIKTEQVAAYVGISRSALEEHFRRDLRCTVHQAILTHKLDVAKDMLARRDASSADVAVRSGFTSLQYMYTVFRRELDCTPREYQERMTSGARA